MNDWMIDWTIDAARHGASEIVGNFGIGGMISAVAGAVLLFSIGANAMRFLRTPKGIGFAGAALLSGLAIFYAMRPQPPAIVPPPLPPHQPQQLTAQEPTPAEPVPPYRPAPPRRRQVTPRPYARTVPPKKRGGYAGRHADAIAALAEERDERAMADPLYLDPKRREERHQERMAKEIARRGSLYLVTAEDRQEPPTIQAAPYVERFPTKEAQIARAQAELARIRQKYGQPPLIGGIDHQRRYR